MNYDDYCFDDEGVPPINPSQELAQGFALNALMLNRKLFDDGKIESLDGEDGNLYRLVTSQIVAFSFERQVGYFLDQLSQWVTSPIERNFFHALVVVNLALLGLPMKVWYEDNAIWLHTNLLRGGLEPLIVHLQYKFLKYKLDFLLEYGHTKLAVECDSPVYHSQRKAVRRDHRKDQELQKQKIAVFRFTGGELHRNPIPCAKTAIEYLVRNGFVWRGSSHAKGG